MRTSKRCADAPTRPRQQVLVPEDHPDVPRQRVQQFLEKNGPRLPQRIADGEPRSRPPAESGQGREIRTLEETKTTNQTKLKEKSMTWNSSKPLALLRAQLHKVHAAKDDQEPLQAAKACSRTGPCWRLGRDTQAGKEPPQLDSTLTQFVIVAVLPPAGVSGCRDCFRIPRKGRRGQSVLRLYHAWTTLFLPRIGPDRKRSQAAENNAQSDALLSFATRGISPFREGTNGSGSPAVWQTRPVSKIESWRRATGSGLTTSGRCARIRRQRAS